MIVIVQDRFVLGEAVIEALRGGRAQKKVVVDESHDPPINGGHGPRVKPGTDASWGVAEREPGAQSSRADGGHREETDDRTFRIFTQAVSPIVKLRRGNSHGTAESQARQLDRMIGQGPVDDVLVDRRDVKPDALGFAVLGDESFDGKKIPGPLMPKRCAEFRKSKPCFADRLFKLGALFRDPVGL